MGRNARKDREEETEWSGRKKANVLLTINLEVTTKSDTMARCFVQ